MGALRKLRGICASLSKLQLVVASQHANQRQACGVDHIDQRLRNAEIFSKVLKVFGFGLVAVLA